MNFDKNKDKKNIREKDRDHEKILLVLLPYWTPLFPPMGIACLKSFLQKNHYQVKADDFNILKDFREIYNQYFDTLRKIVPGDKRGNFFSIGHDLLQNHMMAYLNCENKNEKAYKELVKSLIFKIYYCGIEEQQVLTLDKIIADFYIHLESYFLDLLAREKPAVLGISVNSCTLPASIFAFQITRRTYPEIKTVMGGGIFCDQLAKGTPNFEILLAETTDYIDKIIIGEGEQLFLKLLRGELPESQRVFTWQDLREEPLDLSAVEVPDFCDFNLELYPYLSAYSSRGCPFQCSFCSDSLMWGKYRKKSPNQVVKELTTLWQTHGYQLFMMSDLLLNPIISDLAAAFIDSETAIYWDGCLRADKLVGDIQNTQLWRRGGFYRARLGLESGSPQVLKLMGKKVSVEQIKQSVSSLAFAGIQTTTLWVLGHPGETEEDFLHTLQLIEELKDNIYEAECRPFYYYLTGQAGSSQWQKNNKPIPLYQQDAGKMLLFQTWVLDCLPSREETYQRVNRFVRHCNKLGIPNIYSLHDTYKADERWKKLHKNAAPSLLEFKSKRIYIDECKHCEDMYLIQTSDREEQGDFRF